jgi:hypothetical protein
MHFSPANIIVRDPAQEEKIGLNQAIEMTVAGYPWLSDPSRLFYVIFLRQGSETEKMKA